MSFLFKTRPYCLRVFCIKELNWENLGRGNGKPRQGTLANNQFGSRFSHASFLATRHNSTTHSKFYDTDMYENPFYDMSTKVMLILLNGFLSVKQRAI